MFRHTPAKYSSYEHEIFFPNPDHTFELITYQDTSLDPTLKIGHLTKKKQLVLKCT
jgi:hypothetical protein